MLLKLDFGSQIPVYQQIRNQIVFGIANGELKPGDKLPTIRALASDAGINMMTANKAYQLLKQEGYIKADRRSGAVVSGELPAKGLSDRAKEDLRLIICEAKLMGMGKKEFILMCEQVFDNLEEMEEK